MKSDFECLLMLFFSADAAEILGQDPVLLNRLVQWCNANDHTGVRGEANRLLASILHHNRSQVWELLSWYVSTLSFSNIFKAFHYSWGLSVKTAHTALSVKTWKFTVKTPLVCLNTNKGVSRKAGLSIATHTDCTEMSNTAIYCHLSTFTLLE